MNLQVDWILSLFTYTSFSVLHIIKEAQQTHGLRHGDFQRYRQEFILTFQDGDCL